MLYHIKIRSTLWLLLVSTFHKDLPGLFGEIEGIDVGQVSCLIRDITSVNDEFIIEYNSWVWINFGKVDCRFDLGPFLSGDGIGEDEITWVYGVNLTSKEVNSVLVDYCGMWLQFNELSLTFVGEFDPMKLFDLIWDIHAIEVCKHTFISIKSSMNV